MLCSDGSAPEEHHIVRSAARWTPAPGRRLTGKVADFGLALHLAAEDAHATHLNRVRMGDAGTQMMAGCGEGEGGEGGI